MQTKAQVQEAKELVKPAFFHTPLFFLLKTYFMPSESSMVLKKNQTNQCHFLKIKRENKVCDEKVKDGIIKDTGGSLSPGNQRW